MNPYREPGIREHEYCTCYKCEGRPRKPGERLGGHPKPPIIPPPPISITE